MEESRRADGYPPLVNVHALHWVTDILSNVKTKTRKKVPREREMEKMSDISNSKNVEEAMRGLSTQPRSPTRLHS